MKKLYPAVLLILILSLLLLAACGEEKQSVELSPLEGWQSYLIVRSDTSDSDTTDAAIKLRGAITDATGVELKLTTDWVKRGEEPPSDTLEILVGTTNRPESEQSLLYSDFVVERIGSRVVINGGSGKAVAAAVDWFIESCVGETISIPTEGYSKQGSYPLANATVDGTPLSSFVVCYDYSVPTNKALAEELSVFLAEHTGIYNKPSEKMTEHSISFATSDTLNVEDIAVSTENGGILLETSVYGYGAEEATAYLMELLDGEELNLNQMTSKPMESFKTPTAEQLAAWSKQANELRETIINTPNMDIPSGATVYYVSPDGSDSNDGKSPETAWQSLDKVNSASLAKGSYVCFERGGLWRGQIKAQAGVTYTAYGEGAKPALYGSPEDGAGEEKWLKTDVEGIWKYYKPFELDNGTLIFNHGEAHAIKVILKTDTDGNTTNMTRDNLPFTDYHDLELDLEFRQQDGYVYIRSDENPGTRFSSIEFAPKAHGFSVSKNNVTIDNFTIKYVGAHGVGASSVNNLTVTNCEVGWIGGGLQGIYTNADGSVTEGRYGNGIELYGSCDNYLIDYCYVYQCYDAGITHQQQRGGKNDIIERNVTYTNNLIEDCTYNIEYFMGYGDTEDVVRYMENIYIHDNILLRAGYGWGEQRPTKAPDAHIKGWDHHNRLEGDFIIENNLMMYSKYMLFHVGVYDIEDLPILRNNIIVQNAGGQFGRFDKIPTTLLMYSYETVRREAVADNEFYVTVGEAE